MALKESMLLDNQNDILTKYKCPKCTSVLRDAVQPSCGHWLCQGCAEEVFEMAGEHSWPPTCPREDCGEQLTSEDGINFFPDRFVRKEIHNTPVKCFYHDKGCTWKGKFGEVLGHLNSECSYSYEECNLCRQHVPTQNFEAHKLECTAGQLCPCAEIGCSNLELMTKTELENHVADNIVKHLTYVTDELSKVRGTVTTPKVPKSPSLQYFPDRFVRKEILGLSVFCQHKQKGCSWEGKFGDLEGHLNSECSYSYEECNLCRQHVPTQNFEAHKLECTAGHLCPCAEIGCSNRELYYLTSTISSKHTLEAPELLQDHFVTLTRHLNVKLIRPYLHQYKVLTRDEVMQLLDDSPTSKAVERLVVLIESKGSQGFRKFVEALETTMDQEPGHKDILGKLKMDPRFPQMTQQDLVTHLSSPGSIADHIRIMEKKEEEIASLRTRITKSQKQPQNKSIDGLSLIELQTKIEGSMKNEMRKKDEEIAGLRMQIVKLEKQLKASMTKLEKQLHTKNSEMEDRDFRLSLIENSSYNGVVIWKIPQFSQRRTDAENGKYTSIFSLPFYTNRYGYKMCLRLYTLGDGIGKNTHMSLFFVIMRGEFDSILQWPFTHRVTFKLLSQIGGRDIVDTFQPDPMSSSFKKPKSDMNIASGCPRFVSHQDLNNGGFIKDDTIFIRCTIDQSTPF